MQIIIITSPILVLLLTLRSYEGEGEGEGRGGGDGGAREGTVVLWGRQEVIVCVKDDGGKMIQMILTIEFE